MQFVGSIGTLSSVALSSTSAVLLAASARKFGVIHNDTSTTLYLAFADTATTSTGGFTVAVDAGSYYEIPSVYQGPISGILASGSGNASVTSVV